MIFTGLLSVAFLGREMQRYKWYVIYKPTKRLLKFSFRFGMIVVVLGLAIVGVTDFIFSDKNASTDTNGIIAGT
jgi:hypothetical protein